MSASMLRTQIQRPVARVYISFSPAAVSRRAQCLSRSSFRPATSFKTHTQARHASFRQAFQSAREDHPVLLPLAIISAVGGAGALTYTIYLYKRMLNQLGNYPENVGLRLRRALYFTDVKLDPVQAISAYHQAIKLSEQEGMHPFSDEVIGIKLELARFLEIANNHQGAIQVLQNMKDDCLKWVEVYGENGGSAADRNRILGKSVQLSVKLAELYSTDFVAERSNAEEQLVWAVETSLREKQRRQTEGVKEGEGPWLDDEQIGAELERLGHFYEEKDNHYLAAQLFLQAVALKADKRDCHTVLLMNNLAASIAQQNPPPQPSEPPPSREQLRGSARAWLRTALQLAATIKPPERNAECDQGCVAATHNLGEFAEMDGQISEARDKYEEAGSIAHAIGFREGVISAQEGLKRLNVQSSTKKKGWF